MSINSMNWVINYTKAKGNARLVLLAICDHAGGDWGVCAASVETLGDDAECTRNTTRAAIKSLLEGNENGPYIERLGVHPDLGTIIYRPVYERPHDKVPKRPKRAGFFGGSKVDPLPELDRAESDPGSGSAPERESLGSSRTVEGEGSKEDVERARKEVRAKLEAEFEQSFWPMYPRKVNRKTALAAFVGARTRRVDLQVILDGLSAWKVFWSADRTATNFIPYAATWLNGDRWEAAPDPPSAASGDVPDDNLRQQIETWVGS